MVHEALPLFIHWEKTLGDLLDRTLKFPKAVRFTFASRIDAAALDVLEKTAEACYASGERKRVVLAEIDLALVRLRVLLRVCHARAYIDHRGFEHVMRNVDDAGRMVGGWRKEQASR